MKNELTVLGSGKLSFSIDGLPLLENGKYDFTTEIEEQYRLLYSNSSDDVAIAIIVVVSISQGSQSGLIKLEYQTVAKLPKELIDSYDFVNIDAEEIKDLSRKTYFLATGYLVAKLEETCIKQHTLPLYPERFKNEGDGKIGDSVTKLKVDRTRISA